MEPAQKLVAALPTSYDLLGSWRAALENRPDLLQAKINIDRVKDNKRFQFNQLFPQLDLTGAYGRTGLSTDLNAAYGQIGPNRFPSSYSYGLILNVPLGNTTARNNYRSIKALLEQAELQSRQVEQSMLIQIQNTIEIGQE